MISHRKKLQREKRKYCAVDKEGKLIRGVRGRCSSIVGELAGGKILSGVGMGFLLEADRSRGVLICLYEARMAYH